VKAMMMADAFASRNHGRAAQAEFVRETHEPVGERPAMMAAPLLGEERDLKAVHVGVSQCGSRRVREAMRAQAGGRIAPSPARLLL
jgi:hypothetical protein